MKKLTNLKGVKALNKTEQQSINGGGGGGYCLFGFCSTTGEPCHVGDNCIIPAIL